MMASIASVKPPVLPSMPEPEYLPVSLNNQPYFMRITDSEVVVYTVDHLARTVLDDLDNQSKDYKPIENFPLKHVFVKRDQIFPPVHRQSLKGINLDEEVPLNTRLDRAYGLGDPLYSVMGFCKHKAWRDETTKITIDDSTLRIDCSGFLTTRPIEGVYGATKLITVTAQGKNFSLCFDKNGVTLWSTEPKLGDSPRSSFSFASVLIGSYGVKKNPGKKNTFLSETAKFGNTTNDRICGFMNYCLAQQSEIRVIVSKHKPTLTILFHEKVG